MIFDDPFLSMLPDVSLDYVDWAERYYHFPKGDRSEGKYRIERTPYLKDILLALSPDHPAQKIVFIKPTQIGATTLSNIILSAIPHSYPANCAFIFPTAAMAERHVKTKLQKAWDAIPELADKIGSPKNKDGSTLLFRMFPGGSIAIAGAGSADVQRSLSFQILLLSDVDHQEFLIHGEGGPVALFEKRTDSYGGVARRKKIFVESTPRLKGISIIEKEYLNSSQGEYHVPCPHCGAFQFLEFGGKGQPHGFKFERDASGKAIRAWFICKECKKEITEAAKQDMLIAGRYVHRFPEKKTLGFKINGFYSPVGFVSWLDIANEFLDSIHNIGMVQVFVNTRLADSFELPGAIKLDWQKVKAKAENYPLFVPPAAAQCVAMGVDTHDNRLDAVIMAFNSRGESWVLWSGELWGDPNGQECWLQLDALLMRDYVSESGQVMRVKSCAIDIGGHRTDAVKNYARMRFPVVIGCQGARTATAPLLSAPRPVDIVYNGAKIPGGFSVWGVGTHEAKSLIYGKLYSEDATFFHTTRHLSNEFFMQLTAEQLKVTINKSGHTTQDWVVIRPGGANHALDCVVYCVAGVSRVFSADKLMRGREKISLSKVRVIDERQRQPSGGVIRPAAQPQKTFDSRFKLW